MKQRQEACSCYFCVLSNVWWLFYQGRRISGLWSIGDGLNWNSLFTAVAKFVSLCHVIYQEHPVRTRYGSVSVSVYGDEDKPALITYPDVALNCECGRFLCGWCYKFCYNKVAHVLYSCLVDMSCFQGLFFCPEAASLLLHNFCIYHITPQGHEVSHHHLFLHILHDHLLLLPPVLTCLSFMASAILQLGAAPIPSDVPELSVDNLADQVADVLDFFG